MIIFSLDGEGHVSVTTLKCFFIYTHDFQRVRRHFNGFWVTSMTKLKRAAWDENVWYESPAMPIIISVNKR